MIKDKSMQNLASKIACPMAAVVFTSELFLLFLMLSVLALSVLWLLFLNIGIVEVPSKTHWTNKLIFIGESTKKSQSIL